MKIQRTGRLARVSLTALALLAAACSGQLSPEPDDGSIQGELQVVIADREDGTSEMQYLLQTKAGEQLTLLFDREPALPSGERIRVFGTLLDGSALQVASYETLDDDSDIRARREQLNRAATPRTRRVAVLMVHWGTPDSQTPATLRGKVFTNADSTAVYYNENSYGLLNLTGDVFGWYQIQAPTSCATSTSSELVTRARAAAQAAGVDLTQYQNTMYYFPRTPLCNWSGLAYVGSPSSPARDSFYNGSSGCVVLAQELLHNFGAAHSHSYRCQNASLLAPGSCTMSEYGDPYDPMGGNGSNGRCGHFNTFQKAAQGWFGKCNNVTVSANGTFDVAPLESASDGIQSLRVLAPPSVCPADIPGCYYYIEHRSADSARNVFDHYSGVLVRLGSALSVDNFNRGLRSRGPYLLDMTPGTTSFLDSYVPVGGTFTDPAGLKITVVSRSTASAQVRVEFPTGGSGAPLCIDGTTYTSGTTPPPPPPPPPTCATGETAFNGKCYFFTPAAQTYTAARTTCTSRGTGWNLAAINSAAENSFVSGLVGSVESWLGGNDITTEGTFVWEGSSTPFWSGGLGGSAAGGAYTNFTSDEPNNNGGNADCVRMVGGGQWRDISCTSSYRAVCEKQ